MLGKITGFTHIERELPTCVIVIITFNLSWQFIVFLLVTLFVSNSFCQIILMNFVKMYELMKMSAKLSSQAGQEVTETSTRFNQFHRSASK